MNTPALIAAANPFLVLLVLAVTIAFYIFQAIFKASMEPKKVRPPANGARPPGAQQPVPVSNRAITSLEDYLKEARRKRAAQETVMPVLVTAPQPRSETKPREVVPELESFRPILVQPGLERRVTKPVPPSIPRATQPAKKTPRAKPQPATPVFLAQSPTPIKIPVQSPIPSNSSTFEFGLPTLKAFQFTPTSKQASPLAQIVTNSLRDPQSMAGALLLREILGPPACARNRGSRKS